MTKPNMITVPTPAIQAKLRAAEAMADAARTVISYMPYSNDLTDALRAWDKANGEGE